ncbi:MAG TPA: methyltransferase domain-containing protein [Mycobacteriales bacterium]|nr:methyltransferase domain-containing protein [Mycobacteriales bacterium]
MDEAKLMDFVHKAVGDVGALLGGSMVVIGDRLGLYRAMAGAGSISSAELAEKTGTTERYVREWLGAQAATGYITYDGDGRYTLPDEHAVPLTDESSPACVIGAFETALGSVIATDRIADAFVSGDGVFWGDHDRHVHVGCERFFRPGYINFLTTTWIPALDGVQKRLEQGIRVADVGCGHGASTIHLAGAYPRSTFTGYDPHDKSVEAARKHAAEAGVADRVSFEVAPAKGIDGSYDLVAFFDCLHDLGDPVGALEAARKHLATNGTILLVEPMAGDTVEDNLNPVGAAYYGFSTLLCTPNSMSQETKTALGAQAGEARTREVAAAAGLRSFRRVAETPFNLVYEVRP